MKRILILTTTALAAVAAIAVLAAGPASAAVPCKSAPANHVCPTADRYSGGTAFKASLVPGSHVLIPFGIGKIDCTESAWEGHFWFAANANLTFTNVSYSSCKGATINVLTTAGAETTWIEGTDNGSLLVFTEVKLTSGGINCIYRGPWTGTELIGGSQPRIIVKGIGNPYAGNSGFCPPTPPWTAEYEVNTPTPLYIEKE